MLSRHHSYLLLAPAIKQNRKRSITPGIHCADSGANLRLSTVNLWPLPTLHKYPWRRERRSLWTLFVGSPVPWTVAGGPSGHAIHSEGTCGLKGRGGKDKEQPTPWAVFSLHGRCYSSRSKKMNSSMRSMNTSRKLILTKSKKWYILLVIMLLYHTKFYLLLKSKQWNILKIILIFVSKIIIYLTEIISNF